MAANNDTWDSTRIIKAIALGVFFWALRRILRVAFGLPARPPQQNPHGPDDRPCLSLLAGERIVWSIRGWSALRWVQGARTR